MEEVGRRDIPCLHLAVGEPLLGLRSIADPQLSVLRIYVFAGKLVSSKT